MWQGRTKSRVLVGWRAAAMFLTLATGAISAPVEDFEVGWTKVAPFGGELYVATSGGNPGGFLLGSDTVGGGGTLVTRGPASFSGDLSIFVGMSWDEFVFPHGSHNRFPSRPVLLGDGGTRFRHDAPLGPMNIWRSRFVAFDPLQWTQVSGTSSFEEVLRSATVGFNLEGSTSVSGPEIGIDNIVLVLGPGVDCNTNGIPDADDIASGTSEDCNTNGVPDECEPDADGDGVIDDCDACPETDARDTIVIGDCDTGVANMMLGDSGCSMADRIAECAHRTANHGAFVRCVAQLAAEWKRTGLISGREQGEIVRCAPRG